MSNKYRVSIFSRTVDYSTLSQVIVIQVKLQDGYQLKPAFEYRILGQTRIFVSNIKFGFVRQSNILFGFPNIRNKEIVLLEPQICRQYCRQLSVFSNPASQSQPGRCDDRNSAQKMAWREKYEIAFVCVAGYRKFP